MMERPRVPYSEIFNTIDGHKDISYADRVQVKAIDLMFDALLTETNIEDDFPGYTLGDRSRLTDQTNPNYGRDLLMSIHTPREFYAGVIRNAVSIRVDDNGNVVEGGFLPKWGESMSRITREVQGESPDEAEAKQIVRDLLKEEKLIFEPTPKCMSVLV